MSYWWMRVKCFLCKLMRIDPNKPTTRERKQHADDFLAKTMNELGRALKERDERR